MVGDIFEYLGSSAFGTVALSPNFKLGNELECVVIVGTCFARACRKIA